MTALDVKAIEFKGTALSVVSVVLNTLDIEAIEAAIAALPGGKRRFFDGDAAVLDFTTAPQARPKWKPLLALLQDYGLTPVAICGAVQAVAEDALKQGLPSIDADELARPGRKAAPMAPIAPEVKPEAVKAEAPVAPPEPKPMLAMVLDKPLRSGQRVYAKGTDLIVTAMVSVGAELIADGNIHVYAPLRGRALAGAMGNTSARVFTTCFEAELVSIAGVYRTFERGGADPLNQQAVQVHLQPGEEAGQFTLKLDPLSLR